MREILVWFGACAVVAVWTGAAYAVVIETEDGKRVGGYLVRQDKDRVVIRCRQADGTDKEETFERAKVTVHQAVLPERLAALRKDKAEDYRDYAEDLAPKRDDPEARELALRLFLIAAYLKPDKLGRRCLLGMSNLARTPAEARRCRAMAYLLDPSHDRTILQTAPAAGEGPDTSRRDFVYALRAFRRGKVSDARVFAQKPGVAEHFRALAGWMSYQEFLDACRGAGPKTPGTLSEADLKIILRAESGDTSDKWSIVLTGTKPGPVSLGSLESLTEWDPRKCHFVKGKWVEP